MKQRGKIKERIIRVLLNEPAGKLTKYGLAKKAECSFPWVHEFLNKLENQGLVKGTEVRNYAGLIDHWLSVKLKPEKREYMLKRPLDLLRGTVLRYALTTYHAENLVQHYLFPSRVDLYVLEEDTEQWHQLITANGLVGGGNVRLLIADSHVLYGSFKREGLNVVSIPQLIVDLFDEGGVCIEAAEQLLERVTKDALRTT